MFRFETKANILVYNHLYCIPRKAFRDNSTNWCVV